MEGNRFIDSIDGQMAGERSTQIPKLSQEVSKTCNQFDTVYSKIVRIFEIVVYFCRWVFARYTTSTKDSVTCLVGKTAIITGGNSGLGLATAILLASRGCRVIIASRRVSEKHRNIIIQKTKNPNINSKSLDLSSFKSVRNFAENIKATEPKIDILINNAAIVGSEEKYSKDGLNLIMQTNFLGPFLLTHLLLDSLKASESARIIFTSSGFAGFHKLGLDTLSHIDNKYQDKDLMFYQNSKLCNMLAAQEFAKRVERYGINVYSVDPGAFRTPLLEGVQGNLRPDWMMRWYLGFCFSFLVSDIFCGARNNLHVLTSDQVENGQHYFQCHRLVKPRICSNQTIVDQIWRQSETLVRLDTEERLPL